MHSPHTLISLASSTIELRNTNLLSAPTMQTFIKALLPFLLITSQVLGAPGASEDVAIILERQGSRQNTCPPNITTRGLDIIKDGRGFSARPRDCPKSTPSGSGSGNGIGNNRRCIGYGHVCLQRDCRGENFNIPITPERAKSLLQNDLRVIFLSMLTSTTC